MPVLSLTKTYQDSTTVSLAEADLDNIVDGLTTFINTTKLDGSNVQDGGIGTDSLPVNGITAPLISDASITKIKISQLNLQESASSGANTLTLSLSITTAGRPVLITLQPTSSSNNSRAVFQSVATGGLEIGVKLELKRGSTVLRTYGGQTNALLLPPDATVFGNPSMISYVDSQVAGTYTYSIVATYTPGELGSPLPGDGSLGPLQYVKLTAMELY